MVLKTVSTDLSGDKYAKQMTELFKKHGITKENLVNITPLGSTIYITYDDPKGYLVSK